jgi:DNA-binding transcriptional regulator YbjK
MTDYAAVLTANYGDAEWSIGDTYESLIWMSDVEPPTQADLDAAWPQVQYDLEYARVEAARRARYQAETDGMYFSAMREDTPNLTDWIAAVDQIKADLPYPPELTE